MAKKNRQKNQTPSAILENSTSPESLVTENIKEIDEDEWDMQEELLDLQDAARRFIVGYKEHWFPGIAKFAANQGVTGQATEAECRRIFALWGAKLK